MYVTHCQTLIGQFGARGLAHITGGGILENTPRMLPAHLSARIRRGSWTRPPIFDLLERLGGLDEREMNRTFNNGLGLIAAVPADRAAAAAAAVGGTVVGEVFAHAPGAESHVELA